MFKYYYFNNLNYPFYITEDTKKITEYTFLDNGKLWEEEQIKFFYKDIDVNKKYNILDIGSQSGLYTLYAKYLPNSKFYAFEPFPLTFNLLNKNIALNNITNVEMFNIGLSDKKCSTILNTCISHNGLHTIGSNILRFNDIKPIDIVVDTIDNLFYDCNIDVDYIKIDTEGYEYYILKGGEKTIKKNKPFIQIEYNLINMKQCNVIPEKLNELIENLGYKILKIIGEEIFLVHNENI
jgi:FkbM family methyltransferase